MNDENEIAVIWAGCIIAAAGIVGICAAAAVVFLYLDVNAWWAAL